MIICTSICANYLPKAMVLAKSAKQHNTGVKTVICLLEKEIPETVGAFPYFDQIILAKDLGFDNFEHHIFKHLLVEAATSVKGQLFKYLMTTFRDETKFVYLDPDIKVMGPLIELDRALDEHEIVLTPHLCEPEDTVFDIKHNEFNSLRHGVFNLGFLAVRRGPESEKFIEWWRRRLELFCYDDKENGLFTDQKWVDLAPGFFPVYILRHPGYNFAPWNYSKRNITADDKGGYLINGEPLRFIHFSGFDSGANEIVLNKYKPDPMDPMHQLTREYKKEADGMDKKLSEIPWSYTCFVSGEKIEKQARLVFREEEILQNLFPNPFLGSNQAFYDIYNKVDVTEWQAMIQSELSGVELSDYLLNVLRINLCLIKSLYENQDIRYLIWGASTSGSITKKIIDKILPNFKCIGYTDKYKSGQFEGLEIYDPENLESLTYDFVIIATSPGKVEVETVLQKKGLTQFRQYGFGYGVL